MEFNALRLPRMTITPVDYEDREQVLEEMREAQSILTIYSGKDGISKVFFTGLEEAEYLNLLIPAQRHIGFFNLLKSVVLTTEKLREDIQKGYEFAYKAIEFLHLKKPLENLENQSL